MGIRHLIPMLEPSRAFKSPRLNPPVLPAAPYCWYPPQVLGDTVLGQYLVGTVGQWTGSSKLTFTYLWTRNGTPIPGETDFKYLYRTPDEFDDIAFQVTATDCNGVSTTVTAASVTVTTDIDPAEVDALYRLINFTMPLDYLTLEEAQSLNLFVNFTAPSNFMTEADLGSLHTLVGTVSTPGYW